MATYERIVLRVPSKMNKLRLILSPTKHIFMSFHKGKYPKAFNFLLPSENYFIYVYPFSI